MTATAHCHTDAWSALKPQDLRGRMTSKHRQLANRLLFNIVSHSRSYTSSAFQPALINSILQLGICFDVQSQCILMYVCSKSKEHMNLIKWLSWFPGRGSRKCQLIQHMHLYLVLSNVICQVCIYIHIRSNSQMHAWETETLNNYLTKWETQTNVKCNVVWP